MTLVRIGMALFAVANLGVCWMAEQKSLRVWSRIECGYAVQNWTHGIKKVLQMDTQQESCQLVGIQQEWKAMEDYTDVRDSSLCHKMARVRVSDILKFGYARLLVFSTVDARRLIITKLKVPAAFSAVESSTSSPRQRLNCFRVRVPRSLIRFLSSTLDL